MSKKSKKDMTQKEIGEALYKLEQRLEKISLELEEYVPFVKEPAKQIEAVNDLDNVCVSVWDIATGMMMNEE